MTRATPLKSPFSGHAVVPRTLSVEHAARGRSGLIYPSGKGDTHGRNGWRTATASVVNTRRVPLIVCIWSPSSRHTRPHTRHTGRRAGCLTGAAMVPDRGRPGEGVSVTRRRRHRAR